MSVADAECRNELPNVNHIADLREKEAVTLLVFPK